MEGVITALLGNALTLGVVLAVFKWWGAAALESHKSQLQAFNDSSLERLRAEMKIAGERSGRFDERRFQAVSEVYGAGADAIDAVERMARIMRLSGSSSFDDDRREAVDAYNLFRTTVQKNRLWLGKDLASDADALRNCLHDIWAQFAFPSHDNLGQPESWQTVHDLVTNKLPPLRSAFEDRAEGMFTMPRPES